MRRIVLSERSREKLLHIEAPGCIVNIQIGLSNDKHSEVTRVDVTADGDRYSGDPKWWARGDVNRQGGVVLVEKED